MRYFVSAGEASGDLHGSQLIARLKEVDRDSQFTFLGGDRMAAAAGSAPLIHFRDMAFMGFSEVIRNAPRIMRNLSEARAELVRGNYDALIVIDYPDFNFKLARTARRIGIPVYYYIPPKVWAWKEHRVRTLRKLCRCIFCIFPFEVEFYRSHGIEVEYVGNPSVEEIAGRLENIRTLGDFRVVHDLTSRPILALIPGSRHGEIRNNLPVMDAVARRHRELQAVVAAAPGIEMELYRRLTTLPVVRAVTLDLMAHAKVALVTSGTATLECALAGTPQVVCYRANGSKLSYNLMKGLLKVKHVSLPNLIAHRTIIPEMLLHHCNAVDVDTELCAILDGPARDAQLAGYDEVSRRLGTSHAAGKTAEAIIADLKNTDQA